MPGPHTHGAGLLDWASVDWYNCSAVKDELACSIEQASLGADVHFADSTVKVGLAGADVHPAIMQTRADVHSATVQSATVLPATVQSATVQSATVQSATMQSATAHPATVLSAIVQSATVQPATVLPATVHATEHPSFATEHPPLPPLVTHDGYVDIKT
ncbi:hypothetical protein PENSPDRAFT_695210 [Peniophora sp. CONT]|nr:hypothetical protein PENSPDRAFT_695210 [Peniophora sp. CONT]